MLSSFLARFGLGRRSTVTFAPQAGQLVSVLCEDGRFAVMKLLATDRHGVHVRLYAQRFDSRPSGLDPSTLSIGAFAPGSDVPFSIGHMPLRTASFARWQPEPIAEEPVSEAELEGFRSWQEARGGYF